MSNDRDFINSLAAAQITANTMNTMAETLVSSVLSEAIDDSLKANIVQSTYSNVAESMK